MMGSSWWRKNELGLESSTREGSDVPWIPAHGSKLNGPNKYFIKCAFLDYKTGQGDDYSHGTVEKDMKNRNF